LGSLFSMKKIYIGRRFRPWGFAKKKINHRDKVCGRYSIVAKAKEIMERFSAEVAESYKPHYNAAPSQLLPVITSESPSGVSTFYWGLAPFLAKNKGVSERIINLRAEGILDKPVFRKALQTQRCLVLADGFYEWKKLGKKTSIPYRFVRKDKALFSFAGIWEEYEDISGSAFHTFSILTTSPNEVVNPIHDRMPVILNPVTEKIWINQNATEQELISTLHALPAIEMESYTVSHRVNSVKNDDAYLILPTPPTDQLGNLTLFG
jgi:putative SOS response-associated peptidase YedK